MSGLSLVRGTVSASEWMLDEGSFVSWPHRARGTAIPQTEKEVFMQAYPHRYGVQATAEAEGSVLVRSEGLPELATAPPAQYGGPGDQWSPETLLVAAAADCFVLTFRAIADASKLDWRHLDCDARGVLDRIDGVVRFTALHLSARLVLPPDGNADRAKRLLEKAEAACLVTRSLALQPTLSVEVVAER